MVGSVEEKNVAVGHTDSKTKQIALDAVFVALAIKLAGYYVFEAFIMGNGMAAALKSVPGNVIQIVVAAIIVLIIIEPLSAGVRAIAKR